VYQQFEFLAKGNNADSNPMSNKDLAAAVASTDATDVSQKFLECASSKDDNGVEDVNVKLYQRNSVRILKRIGPVDVSLRISSA
jgi:hypothetical protein